MTVNERSLGARNLLVSGCEAVWETFRLASVVGISPGHLASRDGSSVEPNNPDNISTAHTAIARNADGSLKVVVHEGFWESGGLAYAAYVAEIPRSSEKNSTRTSPTVTVRRFCRGSTTDSFSESTAKRTLTGVSATAAAGVLGLRAAGRLGYIERSKSR